MKRRTVLKAMVAAPAAAMLPAPQPELYHQGTILFDPPLEVPAIPAADLQLDMATFARKYINPAMRALADSYDRELLSGRE